MKAKTIKAVIRKKIDEWLATIEDEDVRKAAEKDVIVTGGCIASMLLKEKVNDFDIYFRTYETTWKVANYYVARFQPKVQKGIVPRIYLCDDMGREFKGTCPTSAERAAKKFDERIKIVVKSAGVASEEGTDKEYEYFESSAEGEAGEYIAAVMDDPSDIADEYEQTETAALECEEEGKPRYRPVFLSSNAITLSNRIQIIIRFYGDPDIIHNNFDYVHCTNYWVGKDNELVLRPAALESLLTRELRYVGSKYPVCSLIRMRKFIKRNWSINAGQIVKMVMQIGQLDLNNPKVLEDQLTGVDVAYFCELIAKLKAKDPDKINHAYLIEIIDRMF